MAEQNKNWWETLMGGFFAPRKDPVPLKKNAVNDAIGLVNPSRLFLAGTITAYNPSVLASRKGLTIFDEMKLDEQVKACLSFKKSAILASGYEIVSPGDQPEDWEVTKFVRDTFTRFPGGFRRALKKLLTKMDYGYSVTEKVYGEVTWMPGKKVLTRLNALMPHYIDFQESQNGELLAVIQRTAVAAIPMEIMPPAKFVVMVHDEEFENHYGRADLEAAYRAWWTKDNTYKWLAIFLERYGMSPLFAIYNPDAYQGGQINALKSIVSNIQNATLGVLPRAKSEDLELWSQQLSEASKAIFLSAMGRFDSDIGKALLVPALIGAGGDAGADGVSSSGSLARSKTHFDSFMVTIDDEKNELDEGVNTQIIPQLCDLNFPGLKSYPRMKSLPMNNETKLEIYKAWAELVKGRIVNQIEDDETHIRKAFQFPENENPDPLKQADPMELADKQLEAKKESKAESKETKEVPDEEQSFEMRQFAEANDAVWVTIGDETVAISRHAWDESKHPRHPKGSGDDGGEFKDADGIPPIIVVDREYTGSGETYERPQDGPKQVRLERVMEGRMGNNPRRSFDVFAGGKLVGFARQKWLAQAIGMAVVKGHITGEGDTQMALHNWAVKNDPALADRIAPLLYRD